MQIIENKTVVSNSGGCQYEPHTLYSLWDMISFLADGLYWPLSLLEGCQRAADKRVAEFGAASLMTRDDSELICRQLQRLGTICETLGLVASQSDICHLSTLVVDGMPLTGCAVVAASIKGLTATVRSEVNGLQFAFIPKAKAKFFDKHDLFGEAVSSAFPSAQAEIMDAGNCIAADLHTAAVFHLMRTAEVGLRVLANTVKAKLPMQIDYATWGQVIDAVQKRLDKLKGKSVVKDKKRQIYSALLLDIRAFCHLWRNPVSHLRGRFSEAGALDAFGHVRDFMLKLTEMGLKETN